MAPSSPPGVKRSSPPNRASRARSATAHARTGRRNSLHCTRSIRWASFHGCCLSSFDMSCHASRRSLSSWSVVVLRLERVSVIHAVKDGFVRMGAAMITIWFEWTGNPIRRNERFDARIVRIACTQANLPLRGDAAVVLQHWSQTEAWCDGRISPVPNSRQARCLDQAGLPGSGEGLPASPWGPA